MMPTTIIRLNMVPPRDEGFSITALEQIIGLSGPLGLNVAVPHVPLIKKHMVASCFSPIRNYRTL